WTGVVICRVRHGEALSRAGYYSQTASDWKIILRQNRPELILGVSYLASGTELAATVAKLAKSHALMRGRRFSKPRYVSQSPRKDSSSSRAWPSDGERQSSRA